MHTDQGHHSYEDNDPSKAAPSTQAPPAPVEPASQPPADDDAQPDVSYNHQDLGPVEPMNQDQEDDDDDVDFNLGGGGGGSGGYNNMNQSSYSHEDAQTPPLGTVHKASAKEDG